MGPLPFGNGFSSEEREDFKIDYGDDLLCDGSGSKRISRLVRMDLRNNKGFGLSFFGDEISEGFATFCRQERNRHREAVEIATRCVERNRRWISHSEGGVEESQVRFSDVGGSEFQDGDPVANRDSIDFSVDRREGFQQGVFISGATRHLQRLHLCWVFGRSEFAGTKKTGTTKIKESSLELGFLQLSCVVRVWWRILIKYVLEF
ncbi:hypothetical protein U1Q18_034466 [Sarracenia purpurea var. burkii]